MNDILPGSIEVQVVALTFLRSCPEAKAGSQRLEEPRP